MTPSMNAHNEQHDPASQVVKQNLTTQPAAAQEAVAYWRVTFRMYPENIDCCETFVRGPDRPTLDTLGISPRPVQIISTEPLYAASVTAAPADTWFADQLTAMGEVIPLDSTPAAPADDEEDAYVIDQMGKLLAEIAVIVNGPEPAGTRWSYHDLPAKVQALASTPAAPGIDLADVSLAAQMLTWGREEGLTDGQIAEIDAHAKKLFALIEQADASPKGDDVAGTLRLLLDERNHRTDGDLKTLAARCLHLSRGDRDLIAMRGALIEKLQQRIAKDSPKGGSDEAAWSAGYRAAMNAAAAGVQELYRNHVHHTGSDGLIARAMELEQSFIRDAAMQAQAGDAEVQP